MKYKKEEFTNPNNYAKLYIVNRDNYNDVINKLKLNNPKYRSLDFSQINFQQIELIELERIIRYNSHVGYIRFGDISHSTQISNIYKKLAKNNESFKQYPSDYIHALISQHIYQNIREDEIYEFNNENWRVIRVLQDQKSNYFGAIYQNTETDSLIIAHRGTLINIFNAFKHGMARTDIKGIFQGQIVNPQFYNWIITFEAIEIARENNCNISVTGHSLGAWHAELSIYFAHKDLNYHNIRCINFDSPGTYTTLNNMESNIINHSNIDLDNLDITTYNSHPNLVNSCNKHVGRVFYVETNFDRSYILEKLGYFSKDALIISDLQSHSLSCILVEFDKKTGKPKSGKAIEMKDWPYIVYKYDKSRENKFLYNATKEIVPVAIDIISSLLPMPKIVEKAAKYIGIELTTLTNTSKFIAEKMGEKIANSIISTSDTSLESIIDILAAYYYKKIDTDQLKELYINDATRNKLLTEKAIVSINKDNSRGFNIKNFDLEYKAHFSPLEKEAGHILFKNHLLIKLNKFRKHIESYPIAEDVKKLHFIKDEMIDQLIYLTDQYKITKRIYHHGMVQYIINVESYTDLSDLSKRLQKLYDINPVVRNLLDNKDLMHRNRYFNIKHQENEQEYIKKSKSRYKKLNEDEKILFHCLFYLHPNRLPNEILDNSYNQLISKLLEKHLIIRDDQSQEIYIKDEIYNEISDQIDIEKIKSESIRFLISKYNKFLSLISCDESIIRNDEYLNHYLYSKIEKILKDKAISNDNALIDKDLFLLTFKYANYQFKIGNRNIAYDFYNDAFSIDNLDSIINQTSQSELSYLIESLSYLQNHTYENDHHESYERWNNQIKRKSSLNENRLSFRERENLRYKNQFCQYL